MDNDGAGSCSTPRVLGLLATLVVELYFWVGFRGFSFGWEMMLVALKIFFRLVVPPMDGPGLASRCRVQVVSYCTLIPSRIVAALFGVPLPFLGFSRPVV
ncbi:hypothetical protein M5K25_007673 [Dendrobium thyrsiflorum]|uniref:Uncharacterized protein n=1 Tax=Dendrobium thyrsiflorum TaxID=117978 RepID=A0ABD0VEN4_DENTH